ncbi:MAG: hydrogenase maturation protease [Candidatus Zixiibacteriota bacterium]
MRKSLIIGVGNEFRGDDSVGIVAARRLRTRIGNAVDVLEHSGEGASLMEAWSGYDTLILIDAVETSVTPGQIFHFDVSIERLPTRFFHYSTHAFGLTEAIETARALGRLPKQVFVYGVQGKRFDTGAPLSKEVETSVDGLVLLILERLNLLSSH